AGTQRGDLEVTLALGKPVAGRPVYAIAELDRSGELDLVPAGDAQPLFADRSRAIRVARMLDSASRDVCVVPVWPAYAWRNLVGLHAASGAAAEPRQLA